MGLFGNKSEEVPFNKRVWTATGIILLSVLVTAIFVYTFNISLLLLAGVVLAVYLRMLTDKLKQWTGWKDMVCYALSIIVTLALATGLFWLTGAKVQEQYDEFEKKLPEMKQKLASKIEETPLLNRAAGNLLPMLKSTPQKNTTDPASAQGSQGEQSAKDSQTGAAAQNADSSNVVNNSMQDSSSIGKTSIQPPQGPQQNEATATSGGAGGGGKIGGILQSFFKSSFGFLGDIYAVFFLGLFLAASPKEYVDGMVSLVPQKGRGKARDLFQRMGINLRKWFKGMTYSVLITFALTAIGLLIIGVDLWLILAIIAGLLTFVPNFGPIISLIPALLVGLTMDMQTVMWIVILYFLVQLVESNLITPFIQKKMIETPAALLLFFQMIMGVLSAGWGVVLATPLLVIIMTIVQELYSGLPKDSDNDNAESGTSDAENKTAS